MNIPLNTSGNFVSKHNEVNHNFSSFKSPINNIIPYKTNTLGDIYSIIKSDKFKVLTNELRTAESKVVQSEIKTSKLDYVTFSGEFSKRSSLGLIQHSNLFCIDLDDLNNIDKVKISIKDLLEPALMFISPSGNGLKVVYKIVITRDITHLDYYKAFEKFFKQELNLTIDEKCKDIPRACFLCHDKDVYYNKDSESLDNAFIDTFCIEDENPQYMSAINNYDEIIEKVKVWLNKTESFIEGNRNNYITRLAGAYNRFGIPQGVAENDLFSYVESDFKEGEIRATIKSVYGNLTYYNIASFDKDESYSFDSKNIEIKENKGTPLLPIDGFPEAIQQFINEYTEVYNTPRDYIAASVIFSTAFAIGNKLELNGKYDNIPLLWMSIVGNVSSGKTDPLKTSLNYFHQKDSVAHKEYQLKMSEFRAYEKLSKKDKEAMEVVKEPSYFQYLLNDYTPESLYKAHTINNRGICIYRDELKGWLDDFGRYSASGEQSTMLSSFYQQPMQINRASKEPINIPKPSIYVCGGIQPDILKDLAKDSRAENGFLSRLMFVYPDLQKKQYYSNKKLDNKTTECFYNYLDVLASIHNPVGLSLSDEAASIYSDWYNKNADQTNKEDVGYLKGVYGKLDVISLRLAIVIHGMNWACKGGSNTEISGRSMRAAIELIEYFRLTALKVYNKIFKDSNVKLTNREVAKHCAKLGASQTKIAGALKITQQAVGKLLK